MAECTLSIGGRVVVRSQGVPDAEYALFKAGDIELRASAPGTVREHSYLTTVTRARLRLEAAGVTVDLARAAATAMHPAVSEAYARGAPVQRVARLLGPAELFEGLTYDAEHHRYEGTFLDLHALASDLGFGAAPTSLQALFLVALLAEMPEDAPVELLTAPFTAERRPGVRTHKRVNLEPVLELPEALRELARDPGAAKARPLGRLELISLLEQRAKDATDDAAHERWLALARAVGNRPMPAKGPLADAELWELELQLADGDTTGALERLDAFERGRGRGPGTTYLRTRLSLLTGAEPVVLLAERASSMAMGMSAFGELELLAAEAWAKAGDLRRALPYARDLIDAPHADAELKARARALVDRATGGAPPAPPLEPPAAPSRAPAGPARSSVLPERPSAQLSRSVSELPPVLMTDMAGPMAARTSVAPPKRPSVELEPPPSTGTSRRRTADFEGKSSVWPDPRAEPEPGMRAPDESPRGRIPTKRPSVAPPPSDDAVQRRTTRPPPAPQPPSMPPLGFDKKQTRPGPGDDAPISLDPDELVPDSAGPGSARSRAYMKGASQPPFVVESPAPLFPKAPLLPRSESAEPEIAEHLSLPGGIQPPARLSLDANPKSVLEARIQFTMLSRELGFDYRLKRGVELRADVRGIEAMQSYLFDAYRDHAVRTADEAHDVRRHGAFLGEILCRTLDAEWMDIDAPDLGHWSMVVPPDTRVWPFGRVLRLILMGHKERDLVSYYFELKERCKRRD